MPKDSLTKIDELHAIAKKMIREGASEDAIVSELNSHGISDSYAEMIIDNVQKDDRDRRDSYKLFFMGGFFVVGGSLLNYFSYKLAEQSNATFFYLFWGVVVLGIITIFRGISLYRK